MLLRSPPSSPFFLQYLSQTLSLRPLWNSDSSVLLCCWLILSDRLTFGGAHVIAPWMSEYFEKSLPNSVPKLVKGKRPGSVEPLFSRSWSPRVPPTPLTICLRPVVPIFVTAALECNVKKDLYRRPNEAYRRIRFHTCRFDICCRLLFRATRQAEGRGAQLLSYIQGSCARSTGQVLPCSSGSG